MFESRLVTSRSSLPSRLKSPSATEDGRAPVRRSTWGPKTPLPSPKSTLTVPEVTFATRRSGTGFSCADAIEANPGYDARGDVGLRACSQ